MTGRTARAVAGGLAMVGTLAFGMAEIAQAASDGPIVSIQSENDLYVSAGDRWYTNGGHGDYMLAEGTRPKALSWTETFLAASDDADSMRFFIGAGQSMFTPQDLTRQDLIKTDRPYAGWLYGEVGAAASRGNMQEIFSVSLGVVGPAALAEESQEVIHKLTDSTKPRGWRNQLRNEPALMISYQRAWYLPLVDCPDCNVALQFSPRLGGALGNVSVNAAAGGIFRIGRNLPTGLPPRSNPGLSGIGALSDESFSWSLFAGLEGRAVARDIFLDGNSFRDSHSVAKKNFVYEIQGGAAISLRRVGLSFSFVVRSKQFKLQPEMHRFGSINLAIGF